TVEDKRHDVSDGSEVIDLTVGANGNSAPKGQVRQGDGGHPILAAISRAGEDLVWIIVNVKVRTPDFINVAASGTGGGIDGHPLLVAAQSGTGSLPGGPAVRGAQQVARERAGIGNAQIIKSTVRVSGQHGGAAD